MKTHASSHPASRLSSTTTCAFRAAEQPLRISTSAWTIALCHARRTAGALPEIWHGSQPGQRALPGSQGALPELQHGLPALSRGLPDLPRGLPSFQRALPGCERALPGLQGGLPRFQHALPKLQCGLPRVLRASHGVWRALTGSQGGRAGLRCGLPSPPSLYLARHLVRVARRTRAMIPLFGRDPGQRAMAANFAPALLSSHETGFAGARIFAR